MSALSIQIPYPIFSDRDGQPLENGYVWIGQPYLDPQTNPVQVYLDDALSIPVAQPLRTIGGYVSNSGTPAQLYIDGVNFSIRVQDNKGTQVYYFPDGSGINPDAAGVTYNPGPDSLLLPGGPISVKAALDEITDDGTNANGAALISFLQAGTGAVPTTVQAKLRETVSVLDFGADPTGNTDSTTEIQAAVTYAVDNDIELFWPDGIYDVSATIVAAMDASTKSVVMTGSARATINSTAAGPIFEVTSADPATRGYYKQVRISGITFVGDGVNTTHGIKLYGACYANSGLYNVFVYGATQYMVYLEQCWAFDVIDCQIGFTPASRTTSGTVGIRVTNGNAVMIRDTIISSIGLDYDGIGVSISSAEASSIENCTIENMEVGIDVSQASGPISIAQNYFENSAVVQVLRDITVPWIKIGTAGVVNEAIIRENWFLIGNNARNVRFYQADRCVFSSNTHNPGFAAAGYYIIDAGCTNITIENNDRIPVIPSSIDAGQYASSVSIASNIDEDTFYVPATSFISAAGTPSLALSNGVPAWLLDPAADEDVSATVSIPTSWGKCQVKTVVLYGASATGNVALSAVPVFIPSDGTTTVSTAASSRIASVSATVNTVSKIEYVNWIDDVEPLHGMVTILVRRAGTNVGDTLAVDLSFYGVVVQRVPL